jgi:(+)-trans-carveol dehydrogenase
MGRVEGKVAFVSGAARGQGRAHALRLAEEGADIIAVDICQPVSEWAIPTATEEDLAETVSQVEAFDRRIVASQVDVRDLAAMEAAMKSGVGELGRLDIVVGNAGVAHEVPVPSVQMDPEAWRTMVEVNLNGAWHTCKAAIPYLKSGSAIVLTASGAAIRAFGNVSAYSAAKAGINGLMRSLAMELGPQGIRINTVNPGFVNTSMIQNQATYDLFCADIEHPTKEQFGERCQGENVLPTPWVEPTDIANAVLFLVSDEARFITGVQLVVDAGLTLR